MTLLDLPPRRILGRFIPISLPPAGTFAGNTVLVIGGTAGIGLAAAVHFAKLGANVIITGRTSSRADSARAHIRKAVGTSHTAEIRSLLLDLNRYDSCTGFVDELKKSLKGPAALDIVLLNAGLINPHREVSPEGWEQTVQVNAISTALLGLLLLAWMREGRGARSSPAHMVFVTSRDHLYPDITDWDKWAKQEGGILGHLSSSDNWPAWWETTEPNYAESKLLVMYAVAEISELARGSNGEPDVIVNSICPGLVNTNIGHSISQTSLAMKVGVPVYLKILGKSPDSGARFCVAAALKPSESHGEFSNGWLTPDQYRKKATRNMTSTAGKALRALVWEEIVTELTTKVAGLEVKRPHASR
ncbi:hypothetical protein F5Y14DRAFT_345533 [Nemania sp. NC0429]|nr:hypothetical protein F5Y14DRAFT_345533 [Nemania sp. NC0429]